MVKIDVDSFKKDLEVATSNIEVRIKRMVTEFAETLGRLASENTPVVNQENILPGGKFRGLYELRLRQSGIEIAQGFHAGTWRYSEGDFTFDPSIRPEEQVVGQIRSDVRNRYHIGDTFYISGTGPAMLFLEQGGSPLAMQGIIKPTLSELETVYQHDLTEAFNRKI